MTLHPVVKAAAEGELPPWAQAKEARREHMARVARLMDEWASARGLSDEDRARWRAAAFLHDALRDADATELRRIAGDEQRSVPGKLLHGPAAAKLLREEGVSDGSLLRSVAFHTLGHPDLDDLGKSLYVADFVEPGRRHAGEGEELRTRMPGDLPAVVVEVAQAKLQGLLERRSPLREETTAFWNALVADRGRPGTGRE